MAFEPQDRMAKDAASQVTTFAKHRDLKRRWMYIMPAVFVT